MSNSIGLAKFKKDNEIVYCEYDGIVDVMRPKLFNSFEEMDKCWKEDQNLIEDCDCDMEDIEIYSGRNFYWKGKACRKCMQICENSNADFSEVIFMEPDWATYHYIKINILQLLEYSFCFGKERISCAMEDYKRLSTSHIALLDGFSRSTNDKFRSHYYREVIFKLSSLELAAGAPKF